jgi:NAD(P)-dependent dehydrogenase (short-subunit alcohol dehydrogenase family)
VAGELGKLRIVVNCAGVATPGKVLGREGVLPLANFEKVIAINLTGTFNVVRLAAEAMAATDPLIDPDTGTSERGVIINTGPPNTPPWWSTSWPTRCSTAKPSALTVPSAWDLSSRTAAGP